MIQTTETIKPPPDKVSFWKRLPGVWLFKNLSIGVRLLIGFGILVFLTLLIAAFNYLGSVPATRAINRTSDEHWPTTLASTNAQTNLLRMQSDVRSYLVLGEEEYRTSYQESEQAFKNDLAKLQGLSKNLTPANQENLKKLQTAFTEWKILPKRLFDLRDDQLEREPAYKLLAIGGSKLAGSVLINMNSMIETQAKLEATPKNLELLGNMAQFQGTFASMFSALRSYATTRNRIYRMEYEGNLEANEFAWDRLFDNRDNLPPSQQALLDDIQKKRKEFLDLPGKMFESLESEHWREDLYIFSHEAIPLATKMQQLLNDITQEQTSTLGKELKEGKISLENANSQALTIGVVVLILGIALAFIFRGNIAGPVRRLTDVANRIRTGDLEAQAEVESRDEIGILARTFNDMTGRLRQTLVQVREEKQRADDLLEVVIPIGVELASEKDFNRLLEKMLVEAKEFCHADAGVLFLCAENNCLEFVLGRNDTLNMAVGGVGGQKITLSSLQKHSLPLYDANGQPNQNTIATRAAITGQTLNIGDIDQVEGMLDTGIFSQTYHTISHLALPLKNSQEQVIGVMELINAQDPQTDKIIPFDPNLQQMMESFSILAVAALEAYRREQQLRQEIQKLRIEIDETKRQQEVEKIVEADSFKDLKAKAEEMRRRRNKHEDDEDQNKEVKG